MISKFSCHVLIQKLPMFEKMSRFIESSLFVFNIDETCFPTMDNTIGKQ